MSRNTWPIIVGGCLRSGTSLVRRVLNAHSGIHCGPEVKFFRDFYGDYDNDALAPFRFFATARSILPDDELLDAAGAAFIRIHERAAALAGKRRWADKTPENVLYLSEWQRLLGDRWLFVHVVRNPLDTLASIKHVKFPRTIPADLEGRIAFYRRYTLAGLEFGDAEPQRYCRVIYDDVVRAPEPALAVLMRQLGEEPEAAQLAFNDQPQQAGLEDPKVGQTTRIHTDSLNYWSGILTRDEAARIVDATGDLWSRIAPDPTGAAYDPGASGGGKFEKSG